MEQSEHYRYAFKKLNYKWPDCSLYAGIVCHELEEMNKDDADYDMVRNLFEMLEEKSNHLSQIEILKEKYSELYARYQKERQEKEKMDAKILKKVMADDSTTIEEKCDLLIQAWLEQAEIGSGPEMPETLWLYNYKGELQLKEEWIDKQAFDTIDKNLSEFYAEKRIRSNIKNALTKYIDLLFDFDPCNSSADEDFDVSIGPDDDYVSSRIKEEHKHAMVKYFDSLCEFCDRVYTKKIMPVA